MFTDDTLRVHWDGDIAQKIGLPASEGKPPNHRRVNHPIPEITGGMTHSSQALGHHSRNSFTMDVNLA